MAYNTIRLCDFNEVRNMIFNQNNYHEYNFETQEKFFLSGITNNYQFKIQQLKKLKHNLKVYENQLILALNKDLSKPEFETFSAELSFLYTEINLLLKNLKKWSKVEKSTTPLSLFYSKSMIYKLPLGLIFIIAPWNYPLQLLLAPMISAIGAGNCVLLKPSEYLLSTNIVLKELISKTFHPSHVNLIDGRGEVIIPFILNNYRPAHVFFTGSTKIGKIIANLCANKLIPYTLELGGKSPVIVDDTAKLDLAIKRIVWGKMFNNGQSCVAPDYLIVHENIKDKFLELIKITILDYLQNTNTEPIKLSKLFNKNQEEYIQNFTKNHDSEHVHNFKDHNNKTILSIIEIFNINTPLMQQELFAPILPIITYSTTEEIVNIINYNPYPLALYVFSQNNNFIKHIIHNIRFGGGAINTTLMQVNNVHLPFGGVGDSGNGYYHGKYGFDTFTHKKSIINMSNKLDLHLKYQPYTKFKLLLLRIFYFML